MRDNAAKLEHRMLEATQSIFKKLQFLEQQLVDVRQSLHRQAANVLSGTTAAENMRLDVADGLESATADTVTSHMRSKHEADANKLGSPMRSDTHVNAVWSNLGNFRTMPPPLEVELSKEAENVEATRTAAPGSKVCL